MNIIASFLFIALTSVASATCPIGTVQGASADACYYFDASPTIWLKAEESCSARKGHLTSISSILTNSVLRQSGSLSSTKEFWLGGNYGIEAPQQWTWTDGRRFSYTNWASGQPVNRDSYCAAIDVSDGNWYSRPCNTRKPFICRVPPTNDPCPMRTTSASPTSVFTDNPSSSTTSEPFLPCRQYMAFVLDVSNGLTAVEFTRQIYFLENFLFSDFTNHYERIALASYAGGIRESRDFYQFSNFNAIRVFLDAVRFDNRTVNWRRILPGLAATVDGQGNTFGDQGAVPHYNFVIFVSQASDLIARQIRSAQQNANNMNAIGRVTAVAMKGIDTSKLLGLTSNFITWDIDNKDAPDDWENQFRIAFGCSR